MRPITEMPAGTAAAVKVVFADIDDTITSSGRLRASAYKALEDLHASGILVAPVTGRPAGWCDMIARFWPVQGIIGENGAFYYSYDRRAKKMIRKTHPELDCYIGNSGRFDKIIRRLEVEVPGAKTAADQPFRLADLAIDFCEDVTALSASDVQLIKTIFEEEGAVAKISSIHVNGWFGDYDKLTMSRAFASDILKMDVDALNDTFVFVGDSPNDAPMFEFFNNSCGVANVASYGNTLPSTPAWIAAAEGGEGFSEIVNYILEARGKG